MGEVLPDVDVFGAFTSADDVVTVTPLNARGIVLVYRGMLLLPESETSKSARRYSTSQPAADAE